MKKIDLPSKRMSAASRKSAEPEPEITNMMLDPRYLRQSSALIQDALQKGFDVLQLANGDIVTTGTKTVVYQYAWDHERGKLVKSKPESAGRKARRAPAAEERNDASEHHGHEEEIEESENEEV